MLESDFKRQFIELLKARMRKHNVPDLDFINVENQRGMPDLVILGVGVWAALEFKRRKNARHRPNQDYNIERLSQKGYARFIWPEACEEVLDELERLFGS